MKLQGLYFDLQIEGIAPELLQVTHFKLTEKLSTLFTLTVDVISVNNALNVNDLLLQKATFRVFTGGVLQRKIVGLISIANKGKSGTRRTFYTMTIRPALWLLTLRQDSRIFHNKSVPDILDELMQAQYVRFDKKLIDKHPVREYTTQKREEDFTFFERLAAEEGIIFWFECPNDGEPHCFLSDSYQGYIGGETVMYNPHPQNSITDYTISNLSYAASMTPQRVIGKDRTYLQPRYQYQHKNLTHDVRRPEKGDNIDRFTVYDSYGRFPSDEIGSRIAEYRLQALQTSAEVGKAESNCILIQPGQTFEICQHPDASLNRRWQPIKVIHVGTLPQSMEEESDGGGATLSNKIDFMPSGKNWRAPFKHKPLADGPELAEVVGPFQEEIYTNELGQVKIHFHWNRYDEADENASCWVRVAQGWNGDGFGFYAVPRIGQEVIVTYLDGDIDRPIITGCTYNALNLPPLNLPAEKTQTVFKSKTHQGEGFNELRFEDANGHERLSLHAQRDMDVKINENETHLVGKDRTQHIKQHDYLKIEGEKREEITKDYSLTIHQTAHIVTAQNLLVKSEEEIHLQSGKRIVIDAGCEIVLKVGSGIITIKDGIVTTSPSLQVGGGSASLGTLSSPLQPETLEKEIITGIRLFSIDFSA